MHLLGVKIDEVTFADAINRVRDFVRGIEQYYIVSINPECVLLAQKNERYREILNNATLALADGFGIILATKLQLPRIPGIDLMLALCAESVKNSWRVYLVGGGGETAKVAAEKLRRRFLGLTIEGEEGIPYEKSKIQNPKSKTQPKFQIPNSKFQIMKPPLSPILVKEGTGESSLISRINQFSPHLLFVALGQPKQELWIADHLSRLPSVRVAMGVGGAFDIIAGKVPRAPLVMRKIGLEWLWRLFIQPWRLPRIFNATIKFTLLVLRECWNSNVKSQNSRLP